MTHAMDNRRAATRVPRRDLLRPDSRRAFLILDVTAALIVAGLLVLVTAAAVRHVVVTRAQSDALRFCRLEAQAALNRVRAGLPADPRGGGPTPEGVTVAVVRTPGTGDWAGFQRCEATAVKTTLGGRQVRVTLATYVSGGAAAP